MHPRGVHHEGLFGRMDPCDQEYHAGRYYILFRHTQYLTFAKPLVIASGLSVGKEGPSVHVACCIGYVVAHLSKHFSRSQGEDN